MICKYIIAILIGIISGVISVWLIEKRKKFLLKKDLKKYKGKWSSHPMSKSSEPKENELWGTVTIEFEKNNILTIYHKNENKNRKGVDWNGKIIINKEYTNTGRIVWQYIDSSPYTDIGYKEIILKEKDDYYLLYLININFGKQEYGFEVCKKKK